MKNKTHLLTTTIALIASAAFAVEPPSANTTKTVTIKSSGSAATAGDPGVSGKATITIDVNGRKETRTIDFGNGTEIQVNADEQAADAIVPGASASSLAAVGEPRIVTWLGVAAEAASDELRAQLPLEPGSGLVVRSVIPDSPAAQAGLQKNDVLMKLDDQLLAHPAQLRTLVSARKGGDSVKLSCFRRGQPLTMDVKLATHVENDFANPLQDIPLLNRLLTLPSRALVLDKDGQEVGNKPSEMDSAVEKLAKTLRDVGVDEGSITEAKRALGETTKALREALADATVAKKEVEKNSGEIARALDQVRDAIEKVRRETMDAVKKERLRREVEKGALEKQP